MEQRSKAVIAYRWLIVLLALGYTIYQFGIDVDYGPPGGPFRYATYWALLLSLLTSVHLLARAQFGRRPRYDGFVAAAAVFNMMVVLLYWRLYFNDPTSVSATGPGPWHQEYYLHLMGPVLLTFDVLFIFRGFRRPIAGALWLIGLVGAFAVVSEFVFAPLNSTPRGTVTAGLPYPFLNNLTAGERLNFYANNIGVAVMMLLGFAAVAWLVRRVLGPGRLQAA